MLSITTEPGSSEGAMEEGERKAECYACNGGKGEGGELIFLGTFSHSFEKKGAWVGVGVSWVRFPEGSFVIAFVI